jgi:tetraacyldisaccharide 4'-kinase
LWRMDYIDLLSGQRRGVSASALRLLLGAAEVPYRVAVALRNRRYDTWPGNRIDCGVPVVSVGNLTTGGTGKTPLVRYIARKLRQRNLRVALVSRGYGAINGGDNDEARELAWALPDVPHLQNADRAASARIAIEELESQVILMDDGFQHRRLHRDLDIVVIDATCPFGYEHMLPRGLLREPIKSLRRADVAVLTRCDCVPLEQREAIRARALRVAPQLVWAEAVHGATGLLQWPSTTAPVETLQGEPVAVLSAIGNPRAFLQTVLGGGAIVVDTLSLRDHDPFDEAVVTRLRQWIASLGDSISRVVCTHKDLVKLQTDRLGGKPLWAVLVDLRWLGGQEAVDRRIDDAVAGVQADS